MLISLNEDFQRMRFQKIQAILNLKEIVTNAGVGYLKVEDNNDFIESYKVIVILT